MKQPCRNVQRCSWRLDRFGLELYVFDIVLLGLGMCCLHVFLQRKFVRNSNDSNDARCDQIYFPGLWGEWLWSSILLVALMGLVSGVTGWWPENGTTTWNVDAKRTSYLRAFSSSERLQSNMFCLLIFQTITTSPEHAPNGSKLKGSLEWLILLKRPLSIFDVIWSTFIEFIQWIISWSRHPSESVEGSYSCGYGIELVHLQVLILLGWYPPTVPSHMPNVHGYQSFVMQRHTVLVGDRNDAFQSLLAFYANHRPRENSMASFNILMQSERNWPAAAHPKNKPRNSCSSTLLLFYLPTVMTSSYHTFQLMNPSLMQFIGTCCNTQHGDFRSYSSYSSFRFAVYWILW